MPNDKFDKMQEVYWDWKVKTSKKGFWDVYANFVEYIDKFVLICYNQNMKDYIFEDKIEILDDNAQVIFIDYDSSDTLKEMLDKHFVAICRGEKSLDDIKSIKLEIKDYLANKKHFQKIGAVAEFFAHLYFINKGFKQECMFLNLEEASAKKGFDGVYSKNNKILLLESKSRNFSKNVNHKANIRVAYNDLCDKFSGKSKKGIKNNPWRNAYNHASHKDVNSSTRLQEELRNLSNEYQQKTYKDISFFNIIPCSTIIDESKKDENSKKKLIEKIKKLIFTLKYKSIIAVAISNRIYDFFLKYLED